MTYAELPDLSDDDRLAADHLRRRGVEVSAVLWDSAAVCWEKFDAVIVRSCWEYHLCTEKFMDWIESMEQKSVPLWNLAGTLHWNIDKSYLRQLMERGVAVPPTVWLERGREVNLASILEERGWSQAVVKPTVSMSAYQTWITSHARAHADQSAVSEMLKKSGVMIQQFVAEVRTKGEWSFVFFQKKYSHAVLKRAKEGDFRVQRDFGGYIEQATPSASLVAQAQRIVESVEGALLYARVDAIDVDGSLLLMELELIDPVLFFGASHLAGERFADMIIETVSA